MAIGTMVSRTTGFLRTAVIASAIGVTIGDSYNLANTLPNIVYELLLGGVLTSVVVPLLVAGSRRDARNKDAYAQRLLTLVTLVLAIASVGAILLAPWIVRLYSLGGHGLPQSEVALATLFARFFLPQILFYGVGAIMGAILNTRSSFAAPMWAPVLNNLVVIATGISFLLIAHGHHPQAGTITRTEWLVLSVGTTLGILAQTVALIPALRATGFRFIPRFRSRGEGMGKMVRLAGWVFLYVLANQVAYLVIINLASTVQFGISSYVYAFVLFSLPHAIVGVSVITALLPRMSRSALDGRLEAVSRDLARGLKLAGAILVPSELLMIVLGPWVATVVFAHFNLSPDSARFVGYVLMGFSACLVPFSIFQLELRAFYAMQDTRTPALINLGVNAVNLVVDIAFFSVLHGRALIVGLAIGYSCSYIFGALVSTKLLRRRIGPVPNAHVVRTYARLSAAAIPAAGLAWVIAWAVTKLAGNGWIAALAALVLSGLVAAGIFLRGATRMKVSEIRELGSSLLSRVSPRASS